jgi:hypothetical protein
MLYYFWSSRLLGCVLIELIILHAASLDAAKAPARTTKKAKGASVQRIIVAFSATWIDVT